jgi:hypothetical protein
MFNGILIYNIWFTSHYTTTEQEHTLTHTNYPQKEYVGVCENRTWYRKLLKISVAKFLTFRTNFMTSISEGMKT